MINQTVAACFAWSVAPYQSTSQLPFFEVHKHDRASLEGQFATHVESPLLDTNVRSVSIPSSLTRHPSRDSDGCSTNVRSNSIRRVSTGTMPGGVVDRARQVHPRPGLVVLDDGLPRLHSAFVGTSRRTTDTEFVGLNWSGLAGHSETISQRGVCNLE